MQDPDPKCRQFGISWHFFGIVWHFGIFAKKSDRKSDPIFLILSHFQTFPDFPIPQLQLGNLTTFNRLWYIVHFDNAKSLLPIMIKYLNWQNHNLKCSIYAGYIQGGRTWQAFGGGKNCQETFRQARIYNFRDKCVVFARNLKFLNLTQ